MKRALITGISGQDGSYLADLLIEKGYKVFGLVRRSSSSSNTNRIAHLLNNPNLTLLNGDLGDTPSLHAAVKESNPDFIFNLAGQSHVRVSFDMPEYTADITGVGVARLLEAVRKFNPDIRLYQASSSEMFGKVQQVPQSEVTPFYPRSPYGAAKMYAHWMCVNYRESYNMFICNGILFNHESILKNSPVIIKKNNWIDILPIEDVFKANDGHKYEGILDKYNGSEVWNGTEWTKIIKGTCYKEKEKKVLAIQTRSAICETTEDHAYFTENNEEYEAKNIKIGDRLFNVNLPNSYEDAQMASSDLAKLIGFIVGDGHINADGNISITGTNIQMITDIADISKNMFGWSYTCYNKGKGEYPGSAEDVWAINLNNNTNWGKWLRSECYTKSGENRIPAFILNATKDVKKSFIDGYYLADGRKAGNETYEYKGFTTRSATLCLGMIYVFDCIGVKDAKCKMEYKDGHRYYRVQYRNGNKIGGKGDHLKRPLNEVISIFSTESSDGWFFDLQTESKTFASGANLVKIHNSPRRGEDFVTRKITKAIANIKAGKQKELFLGNLDAKRDWAHSKDYCRGMLMMLEHDTPDDYVLATGKTYSVRQFLDMAFNYAGLKVEDHVRFDQAFIRPAEVDLLIGDASKAKRVLGWEPIISFEELVKEMVDHDLKEEGVQK